MNVRRLHRITRALPPLLPVALVLAASVPLGSAHPVWRYTLTATLWLFCATVFLLRPPRPAAADRFTRPARGAALALLGWVVFQCLPLPWSPPFCGGRPWISCEPGLGVLHATAWLACAAFALASARLNLRRESLERTLHALMAAGVVQCLLAFARFAHPDPAGDPFFTPRFRGTFPSGNSLGAFLLLTLSATLGLLLRRWPELEEEWRAHRRRGRHIALRWMDRIGRVALPGCAGALQVGCLFMTGSRGALAGAAVMAAVLSIRFLLAEPPARPLQRLAAWAGAIALAGSLGLGGGFWIARQRLALLAEVPGSAASLDMRLEIWSATAGFLRQHPLGCGLGNFSDATAGVLPAGPSGERSYHAHNDFLEAFAELGWPGGVLALFLLTAFLLRHARWLALAPPGDAFAWLPRALWAGLLGALTHAAVDFNLSSRPAVTLAFFLCAGLLEALRPHPSAPAGRSLPRPGARPTRQRRAWIAAATLPLALVSAVHAAGEWCAEKGWIAAGGAPDPYLGRPARGDGQPGPWFALACRLSPLNAAPLARAAEAGLFLDSQAEDARRAWRDFAFFPPPPGPWRASARAALRAEAARRAEPLAPPLARLRARTDKPGLTLTLFAWQAWLVSGSPSPVPPDLPRGQANDADTFLRLFELHLASHAPAADAPPNLSLQPARAFLRAFPRRTRDLLDSLPPGIPLEELLDLGYAPEAYAVLASQLDRFTTPGSRELLFLYWGKAIETTLGGDSPGLRLMRREWARRHATAMADIGDWAALTAGQEQYRTFRALAMPPSPAHAARATTTLLLEKRFQEGSLSTTEAQTLLTLALEQRKKVLAADVEASLTAPEGPPPEPGRVDTGVVLGNDALEWIGYRLDRASPTHPWIFTAWLRPRRALPVDLEMRVGLVAGEVEFASGLARLQEANPEVFHLGDPRRNQIMTVSVPLPAENRPRRLRLSFASPKTRAVLPTLEGLPALVFPVDPGS